MALSAVIVASLQVQWTQAIKLGNKDEIMAVEDEPVSTPTFDEMEEIGKDMTPELWQELENIGSDVLNSGYWFVVCLDIARAWDVCHFGPDANTELAPILACEALENETEEQRAERCHKGLRENKCRNQILNYFARVREAEIVYHALLRVDGFRNDLNSQCSGTLQALNEFPYYEPKFDKRPGGHDELLDALEGLKSVQDGATAEDLSEFTVLQPDFWLSNDNQTELTFETALLLQGEPREINEKFTEDLDLFYTQDDVTELFNYVFKDYETICTLAR